MVREVQLSRLARIPPIIRYPGLPPDILVNFSKLIQDIIRSNKLIPVSKLEVDAPATRSASGARTSLRSAPAAAASLNDSIDWWWKYGGMKSPHLHFNGDVFALNETQWQAFSSAVLKDFSRKLAGAKTIGFDQLIDVSDAVNRLG